MILQNSIYIAGPMTGIKDYNFPAFHAAAERLRSCGFTVVNPAEITPEFGHPWSYYMRRDIPELVKCQTIYLLPGWENSKGATLERHIAERLGMHIIYAAG